MDASTVSKVGRTSHRERDLWVHVPRFGSEYIGGNMVVRNTSKIYYTVFQYPGDFSWRPNVHMVQVLNHHYCGFYLSPHIPNETCIDKVLTAENLIFRFGVNYQVFLVGDMIFGNETQQ